MGVNLNTSIFTLGHYNYDIDIFVSILADYDISTVVDVRSYPFSKRNIQYRKDTMSYLLHNRGIKYVFLGDKLGGMSEDESLFTEGILDYKKVTSTEKFKSGIDILSNVASSCIVSIVCTEQDPLRCHRFGMISPVLRDLGFQVNHILGKGHVKTQDELEHDLMSYHQPTLQ